MNLLDDYWSEDQVLQMTGWSDSTADNYRRRGKGPAWVRLGKNVYYPKDRFAQYLSGRVREPNRVPAASAL